MTKLGIQWGRIWPVQILAFLAWSDRNFQWREKFPLPLALPYYQSRVHQCPRCHYCRLQIGSGNYGAMLNESPNLFLTFLSHTATALGTINRHRHERTHTDRSFPSLFANLLKPPALHTNENTATQYHSKRTSQIFIIESSLCLFFFCCYHYARLQSLSTTIANDNNDMLYAFILCLQRWECWRASSR